MPIQIEVLLTLGIGLYVFTFLIGLIYRVGAMLVLSGMFGMMLGVYIIVTGEPGELLAWLVGSSLIGFGIMSLILGFRETYE